MPIRVDAVHRVIVAVSEHIESGKAVTSAYITVRIDKSANFGVIITTLEIVEAGFGVVIVATVTQGVDLSHCTRGGNYLAVWVVVIGCDLNAICINQIHHVTLEIGNVITLRCCRAVVVDQAVRHPDVVISEIKRLGRRTVGDCFAKQLPARVDVLVDFAVSRLDGDISVEPGGVGKRSFLQKKGTICSRIIC